MVILLSGAGAAHSVILFCCYSTKAAKHVPPLLLLCNMRRAWLCISDDCWVFVSACCVDFVLTLFKRVLYSYTILVLLCLNTPQQCMKHKTDFSAQFIFILKAQFYNFFFNSRDFFMSVPLRLLYVNDWIIFACKNNNILANFLNTEQIVIYIYMS